MAYATVADLQARWRPLSEAEQARAEVLLEDAAVYLNMFVDVDEMTADRAAAMLIVSCSMVQRAMLAAENGSYGIEKQTISADIYSQSFSYANPNGDLFLTASEKRLLGITSSYMQSVRPHIDPVKVEYHEYYRRDC